jgi:hypothetical protein
MSEQEVPLIVQPITTPEAFSWGNPKAGLVGGGDSEYSVTKSISRSSVIDIR